VTAGKPKQPARQPSQIASQQELAYRLGWPRTTLRDRMKDPEWPIPRRPPWPAWDVRAAQVWADRRFAPPPDPATDLLVGGAGGDNSPALEMYRQERARLARLERLEREGTLVRRDRLHEALAFLANLLRQTGEQLCRQCKNDCGERLQETLRELVDFILKWDGAEADLYEEATRPALPAPAADSEVETT